MGHVDQPVALVVGASRGIGRQVAIDLAKNGYTVVVAAKSTSDASKSTPWPVDPNSNQSTINTVEREIREAGGHATALQVDTRDVTSIQRLVDQTVALHRRLDVLIYNSGAIWWASVEHTPTSRFQLLQRVNPEGLYATVQACLPHFRHNAWQGRIIVVSPPIYSRFFRGKTAYAMGKMGMSILTQGLAMDWVREGKTGMAITSIWPASAIESAATRRVGAEQRRDLRRATIFADATLALLRAPKERVNGLLVTDEDFLREYEGVRDFGVYAVVEGAVPRRIMPVKFPDLTVEEQDDEGVRMNSTKLGKAKL